MANCIGQGPTQDDLRIKKIVLIAQYNQIEVRDVRRVRCRVALE